jgi:hypothetical protein
MPIMRVVYRGLTLYAGAFEVPPLDRFISTLYIEKDAAGPAGNAWFLDPPCPEELFASAREALESAIAFGRATIDDGIPGLTGDRPKSC